MSSVASRGGGPTTTNTHSLGAWRERPNGALWLAGREHDIVVKQHGGTIDVDTVPGEFTEFIVTLPRTGC